MLEEQRYCFCRNFSMYLYNFNQQAIVFKFFIIYS